MGWEWYEHPDGGTAEDPMKQEEGYWRWDKADGPQEVDRRSLKEQGTKGERHLEKVSNDGLDTKLREGTGRILHKRSEALRKL